MFKAYLLITFLFIPFFFLEKSHSELERSKANRLDKNDKQLLSDDEISYILSDLSMYDLNTLSQLIDVMNEQGIEIENDIKDRLPSDELARFKRKTSLDVTTEENHHHSVSNVNKEEYIRQLDDSFPNVDRSNQDDKEEEHIRVKRY